MSDNSDADQQTIQKRPRKQRVLTDAHREKLIANVAKARAIRVTKSQERKEGRLTDELIMKEIIEEKKKSKIFGEETASRFPLDDPEPKPSKPSKQKKEKVVESSESEPESEISEDEDDVEDDASESESSSSDSEAEFVLKRAPKKSAQPKVTKMKAVKKDKQSKKEAESILAKMEAMTAEIASLKKEKRKQSKVNVYVNQPEKKPEMTPQQRRNLLDL